VQHRTIILLLILDVIGVFVKGLEEKQQRLAFVQADSRSCSSLHTLSVAPPFPDDHSTWHGWVCFPWPEASAMEDIQTRKGQILQLATCQHNFFVDAVARKVLHIIQYNVMTSW